MSYGDYKKILERGETIRELPLTADGFLAPFGGPLFAKLPRDILLPCKCGAGSPSLALGYSLSGVKPPLFENNIPLLEKTEYAEIICFKCNTIVHNNLGEKSWEEIQNEWNTKQGERAAGDRG